MAANLYLASGKPLTAACIVLPLLLPSSLFMRQLSITKNQSRANCNSSRCHPF